MADYMRDMLYCTMMTVVSHRPLLEAAVFHRRVVSLRVKRRKGLLESLRILPVLFLGLTALFPVDSVMQSQQPGNDHSASVSFFTFWIVVAA